MDISKLLNRLVCFAVLCMTMLTAPAWAQLNLGPPKEVENVTVDQRLGETLPLDLSLKDEQGRDVKLAGYFDGKRPVLVTMNYSDCPVLCSVQLNALVDSLNKVGLQLGNDFQVLTVSIDPNESTQRVRETKTKYVSQLDRQPGAAVGWHFCTARETSIKRLADTLGFRYTYDKTTKQYYHPAMLAFVSPKGVITRYSLAVEFPPDQIKLALLDASNGTIGSPVDQFVMWCFSYDAERGSYVLVAWRLMRLGAALTVFILLLLLIPYWVGRRRSGASSTAAQPATAT